MNLVPSFLGQYNFYSTGPNYYIQSIVCYLQAPTSGIKVVISVFCLSFSTYIFLRCRTIWLHRKIGSRNAVTQRLRDCILCCSSFFFNATQYVYGCKGRGLYLVCCSLVIHSLIHIRLLRTVKPQLYTKIKQSACLKYIKVNTYFGTTF